MKRTRFHSSDWLWAILPAAALLAIARPASAATWTVHVGQGGTHFVDDASGTSTTTIAVGDTVTWVWVGTMQHSVTSGTCGPGGGGNGGGGAYGTYGGGGGACTDAAVWTSTGFHTAGFQFSQTFSKAGTVPYFCAMHQSAMTGKVVVGPAPATTVCTPDAHTLCLNGGRFSVTTHWTNPNATNGDGTAISLTDDSGYFWFFDPTNIESTVKVLSGCAIDNAYWVFAAGLTNVEVLLTVVDTKTGTQYTKTNPRGVAFAPIQDTSAFPTSCP
jgi:plastocyanin